MKVKTILIIEGGFNLFVFVIKLMVGLATGSSAILSDAFHSLSDGFNNVVAFLSVDISERPADSDHPYGHRKYEQLAVFVLATSLVFVAIELVHNAFTRESELIVHQDWALVLLLLALLGNFALSAWQNRQSKKLKSDILHADARHTFSDSLTSLLALAGWQISAAFGVWVDTLVTVIMALLLVYFAFQLFRRAIPILVDESPANIEQVHRVIRAIEGVEDVLKCRCRSDGNTNFADITVLISAKLSTQQGHIIADEIEDLLSEKFDISDTSVHVEPSD